MRGQTLDSYDMGWGVEKNETDALKWDRKASVQGCKLADDMISELEKQPVCALGARRQVV